MAKEEAEGAVEEATAELAEAAKGDDAAAQEAAKASVADAEAKLAALVDSFEALAT